MAKLSVTRTEPILPTRPTSLRPRSSSIRCSARSLGSASSSASSALSSSGVAPRGRVPASGRMVTSPSRTRTSISGLEPDQRETAEIEIEQERRRIGAAERAVERERRQRERHREALRQHHLEDVAGGDVFLGLLHHARELGRRRIGDRLGQCQMRAGHGCRVRQGLVQRVHDAAQALQRVLVGRLRLDAGLGTHRRDDDHFVLHGIEDDHDGRSHEHAVGHVQRIGTLAGQALDEPDGVVTHVADDAGSDRRQPLRQVDARFGCSSSLSDSRVGWAPARRHACAFAGGD